MGRPKKGAKKVSVTDEIKTRPVRLDFPPDLHHKLRVVAAEEGLPMAVFCREHIGRIVLELWESRGRKR